MSEKRKGINWLKADWTKHDAAIAKEMGCSRVSVAKARSRLGLPKVRKKAKIRISQKEELIQLRAACMRVCRMGSMGMEEFLPEWIQKAWAKTIQQCEDALQGRYGNEQKEQG